MENLNNLPNEQTNDMPIFSNDNKPTTQPPKGYDTPAFYSDEKKPHGKPLVVAQIEAVVYDIPRRKVFKKDNGESVELWEVYVQLKTSYRPPMVKVYYSKLPTFAMGDVIPVEIQTTDYKVKGVKEEQQTQQTKKC